MHVHEASREFLGEIDEVTLLPSVCSREPDSSHSSLHKYTAECLSLWMCVRQTQRFRGEAAPLPFVRTRKGGSRKCTLHQALVSDAAWESRAALLSGQLSCPLYAAASFHNRCEWTTLLRPT